MQKNETEHLPFHFPFSCIVNCCCLVDGGDTSRWTGAGSLDVAWPGPSPNQSHAGALALPFPWLLPAGSPSPSLTEMTNLLLVWGWTPITPSNRSQSTIQRGKIFYIVHLMVYLNYLIYSCDWNAWVGYHEISMFPASFDFGSGIHPAPVCSAALVYHPGTC